MDNKFIKEGEFLAIYTDIDEDNFSVGKVLQKDKNYLIISSVDTLGNDDGLILQKSEEIYKVERNTQYLNKLKNLMKLNKIILPSYSFQGETLLVEVLEFAKHTQKLVEVQLCNAHRMNTCGIVNFFDENVCEILQVDSLGQDDGSCYICMDDITAIKYCSNDSKNLYMLKLQRMQD